MVTVKSRGGDLVVPAVGGPRYSLLHLTLAFLHGAPAGVGVLTDLCPVQLVPLTVVAEGALVGPPLGNLLQLSVPHLQEHQSQ